MSQQGQQFQSQETSNSRQSRQSRRNTRRNTTQRQDQRGEAQQSTLHQRYFQNRSTPVRPQEDYDQDTSLSQVQDPQQQTTINLSNNNYNWDDIPDQGVYRDQQEVLDKEELEQVLDPEFEIDNVIDEQSPYYYIKQQKAKKSDIYFACHVGDLERTKFLVEEQNVDINRRDIWDAVPLYYACLCGHIDIAEYLLQKGAICSEYTFDGDRCHYAALQDKIRKLLKEYETRPPPLQPLATDLKRVSPLVRNSETGVEEIQQIEQFQEGVNYDFAFIIDKQIFKVNRAVMAVRSPYFRKMLETKWKASNYTTEQSDRNKKLKGYDQYYREVWLKHPQMSQQLLISLIQWMYTDRVDLPLDQIESLLILAKKCRCSHLVAIIEKEMRSIKYHFKSCRRDSAPRKFILHPSMIGKGYTLSKYMSRLRQYSQLLEQVQNTQLQSNTTMDIPSNLQFDYADVAFDVEGKIFRAHAFILQSRSEFFKTFLEHSKANVFSNSSSYLLENIQYQDLYDKYIRCYQIEDVSQEAFEIFLQYVYSDELELNFVDNEEIADQVGEYMEAADRFLVFPMKKNIAQAILNHIDSMSILAIIRLLFVSDRFTISALRDRLLSILAEYYDQWTDLAFHSKNVKRIKQQDPVLYAEFDYFKQFVKLSAPQHAESLQDFTDQILEDYNLPGASKGNIEGSGFGGQGYGTILNDLREKYLELNALTRTRDANAKDFDRRLYGLYRA